MDGDTLVELRHREAAREARNDTGKLLAVLVRPGVNGGGRTAMVAGGSVLQRATRCGAGERDANDGGG
jgi:hypothetical protein